MQNRPSFNFHHIRRIAHQTRTNAHAHHNLLDECEWLEFGDNDPKPKECSIVHLIWSVVWEFAENPMVNQKKRATKWIMSHRFSWFSNWIIKRLKINWNRKRKKNTYIDELFMVNMPGCSFVLKAFDSNQMYIYVYALSRVKNITSTNCNRIRF